MNICFGVMPPVSTVDSVDLITPTQSIQICYAKWLFQMSYVDFMLATGAG
jgi:hypothetical protein